MKRILIISSGSKNNAALIENNGNTILIDCGVSLRSLRAVYKDFSLDMEKLRAVFVTHDHSDHTGYIKTLKKNLNVPFYSGADIADCEGLGDKATLEGFEVSAFACPHDVPCVGYRVNMNGTFFAIATDVGSVTDCVLSNLEGCDAVMLESNHDVDMVRFGPYVPSLKSRILSDRGHLSNRDCSKAVCFLASKGLKKVILAHLSETNNTPLIAKSETRTELLKYGFEDVEIYAAEPKLEVIL